MPERGLVIYDVLRHLRPVVLNSARVVEAQVRALGWTVGSRAVVEVLSEGVPATVPQVAARLSLARQNVQRHVDELVRLGHAETLRNPAHRRSVHVQLTSAGRDAFARTRAQELVELASLAPECSDEELAASSKVLAALDRDIRTRAVASRQDSDEPR